MWKDLWHELTCAKFSVIFVILYGWFVSVFATPIAFFIFNLFN